MSERPTISYITEPAPERPIPTYVDGKPAYGPGSESAERGEAEKAAKRPKPAKAKPAEGTDAA
jgi:hypothetical protein